MKIITLLLIICLLVIPLVSAENETVIGISENFTITAADTNVTQPDINVTKPDINVTKLLPEEFYGSATYSDGSPVVIGSKISVMDQRGKIIGNFTMVFNGSYGDSYASAPRLLVYASKMDDEIRFYINDIQSSTPARKFDSGSIKRADIVVPLSAKPTPTPTPTPEPTLEPTIVPTTEIPTPTPEPTIIPTTINTPIPTPTQVPVSSNDTTIKFVGVLLIAIAICVVGSLLTYYILTKKMKRDDEEDIIL
jgi:hypothetical protein